MMFEQHHEVIHLLHECLARLAVLALDEIGNRAPRLLRHCSSRGSCCVALELLHDVHLRLRFGEKQVRRRAVPLDCSEAVFETVERR